MPELRPICHFDGEKMFSFMQEAFIADRRGSEFGTTPTKKVERNARHTRQSDQTAIVL